MYLLFDTETTGLPNSWCRVFKEQNDRLRCIITSFLRQVLVKHIMLQQTLMPQQNVFGN